MFKNIEKLSVLASTFLFLLISANTSHALEEWTTFLNSNYVNSLAIEGNSVYCGTNRGGLVRWDRFTGQYRVFTIRNGLIDNTVRNTTTDKRE